MRAIALGFAERQAKQSLVFRLPRPHYIRARNDKKIMKIYNTLTRKKEEFKPIKKEQVGLYTCGPTVYNYAHIGNLRTYVFEDILKRVLLYNNYNIKHVMNITDVGHLTSDEDEGEDKMDVAVKREQKTPEQIAQLYAKAFKDDISKLNILEPDIWCKATEHITDMIKLIQRIEKNGYSYTGKNGNVYFDTSKFADYEKFARLDLENLRSGARTEIDKEKKHPGDKKGSASVPGGDPREAPQVACSDGHAQASEDNAPARERFFLFHCRVPTLTIAASYVNDSASAIRRTGEIGIQ